MTIGSGANLIAAAIRSGCPGCGNGGASATPTDTFGG